MDNGVPVVDISYKITLCVRVHTADQKKEKKKEGAPRRTCGQLDLFSISEKV